MNKRGLNQSKRLSALLGNLKETQQPTVAISSHPNPLRHLPIEFLQRGRYQPRQDIQPESLQELADSIKAQGIIQPIIVRSVGEQKFEIIAGERRWRAAQLAGLSEVPTLVQTMDDETAMAVALIENIQREDLNPLEEAMAMQRLVDEFELTQQEVAEAVGKSRTAVANFLRLLKLNPDVKRLLEHGDLEMGHARALLSLTGLQQTQIAQDVVRRNLSVRETENLVRRLSTPSSPKSNTITLTDPNIRHLQNGLSTKLGAKVAIQTGTRGKGKLTIHYNSTEELEGILEHIQ